jgi:hypothetical protein
LWQELYLIRTDLNTVSFPGDWKMGLKGNTKASDERSQRLVLKEDPCEDLASRLINFFPDIEAQTAKGLAPCKRHYRMSIPGTQRH